jgi:hypothetical protein
LGSGFDGGDERIAEGFEEDEHVDMATGRNPLGSSVPYLHPPTLTPTR